MDCAKACKGRCAETKRPNLCKRACGSCCKTCNCVPPGTSGNYDKCPCYFHLHTHNHTRKCPQISFFPSNYVYYFFYSHICPSLSYYLCISLFSLLNIHLLINHYHTCLLFKTNRLHIFVIKQLKLIMKIINFRILYNVQEVYYSQKIYTPQFMYNKYTNMVQL